jgi:hypothetical protein
MGFSLLTINSSQFVWLYLPLSSSQLTLGGQSQVLEFWELEGEVHCLKTGHNHMNEIQKTQMRKET